MVLVSTGSFYFLCSLLVKAQMVNCFVFPNEFIKISKHEVSVLYTTSGAPFVLMTDLALKKNEDRQKV